MIELDTIVKEFQNKNIIAFEKIYKMYYKSINGIIFRMLKNEQISDELTQDVFLKAWNNSEKYSPKKGRIFTWLLCIARNLAIDKIRSKEYKNSKKNIESEDFLKLVETKESLNRLTNTIGIRSLMSNLKTSQAEIIDLIYFKGYTQKETSEELNIPLGTVKTRNRSGLRMLKLLF